MLQVRQLISLLLALCLSSSALAFSVPTKQMQASTALKLSTMDENEILPEWTQLPRSRAKTPDLDKMEIGIGRVAMVGFIGLLAREVISGESFGQQILEALTGQ